MKIDLLLVVRAQRGPRLLADNGEHGLMIEPRIVKARQQMRRARPEVAMQTPSSPVNFA